MGTDAAVSVAFIVAVVGLIVTIYNFVASRKKDTQVEDGKMEEIRTSVLKANIKLDNACGSLTEIRTDIKAMQSQIMTTQTDLAVVQRDLKTAFSRIDEMRDDITSIRSGNR